MKIKQANLFRSFIIIVSLIFTSFGVYAGGCCGKPTLPKDDGHLYQAMDNGGQNEHLPEDAKMNSIEDQAESIKNKLLSKAPTEKNYREIIDTLFDPIQEGGSNDSIAERFRFSPEGDGDEFVDSLNGLEKSIDKATSSREITKSMKTFVDQVHTLLSTSQDPALKAVKGSFDHTVEDEWEQTTSFSGEESGGAEKSAGIYQEQPKASPDSRDNEWHQTTGFNDSHDNDGHPTTGVDDSHENEWHQTTHFGPDNTEENDTPHIVQDDAG